jgi:hypothetical protein
MDSYDLQTLLQKWEPKTITDFSKGQRLRGRDVIVLAEDGREILAVGRVQSFWPSHHKVILGPPVEYRTDTLTMDGRKATLCEADKAALVHARSQAERLKSKIEVLKKQMVNLQRGVDALKEKP